MGVYYNEVFVDIIKEGVKLVISLLCFCENVTKSIEKYFSIKIL